MADPRSYVAGSSSLVLGADSYTAPTELSDKSYIMGQNVVCRGGIVQTRPGTRTLFCAPDGNFQGLKLFTPDNGVAQLVFAVDGKIYASAAPFASYRRIWQLQFSPTAKYIAWSICLKSTDYDNQGNLVFLDNPYSVLVMQDGLTRAAYWDGSTAAHLNPTQNDTTDTAVPGYNETPIGLWMIWSGNRLWVSRGNQIFASDIGNPLKFTEATYLNEARAFYLSGPCTGMIETADQQGIIAFTETNGTFFQSSIQQRTDWLNTPNFQKVIIPNVGCVAPRSLVTQYGLNWWFGAHGLTNINAALRQNLSSRIDYQDNQMFSSKAYLSPDLSGICASYYENYLMVSVPSGDVLNRHTWVLDQAPMQDNANAWTGFWSGWRPIEWARGLVNGSEHIYFGSVDYDGKNRIWEAMLPERTDNGCAITCYALLRDHAAGNLDPKAYEWTKLFLSQMYGDVYLNAYVAATKGGYQLLKKYKFVASEGQIFANTAYSEVGPLMVGNRVQSRTVRTPELTADDACNQCGVESEEGNLIDYAFTHLLVWSGQMGLRAYQMHMRAEPERDGGDCVEDEVGPRTLNEAGCSGLELFVDTSVFETFTAHAEGTVVTPRGMTAYIRRTAVSPISQEHAQAMANCSLSKITDQVADSDITDGVYDSGAAEVGDGTYVIVSSPEVANAPAPPPETGLDIEFYVIGGGGGGCAFGAGAGGVGGAGGGGGGGCVNVVGPVAIDPTIACQIVVGVEGLNQSSDVGLDGGFSSFSYTLFGGGFVTSSSGGGEGGASVPVGPVGQTGGSACSPLGIGGDGSFTSAGGGGGETGAGSNYDVGHTGGGDGGAGETIPIDWANPASMLATDVGMGGGGGTSDVLGTPGLGGAGSIYGANGADQSAPASSAHVFSWGSGGGGGSQAFPDGAPGTSGFVVVRYDGAAVFSGGIVSSFGGKTYHAFPLSGLYSLTPI